MSQYTLKMTILPIEQLIYIVDTLKNYKNKM